MGERQPSSGSSRWAGYYARTADRPPRETLLRALARFDAEPPSPSGARLAVDLGCGTGRDAIELLRRGWRVLAIDAEPEALRALRARPDLPPDAAQETRHARFEDARWPAGADLVNASFALPFCPPLRFPALWARIVRSLRKGGRFTGQLLGDRDGWASDPALTAFTQAEAETLLAGLDVEDLWEEETDTVTPRGEAKRWHLFHIVARRP